MFSLKIFYFFIIYFFYNQGLTLYYMVLLYGNN